MKLIVVLCSMIYFIDCLTLDMKFNSKTQKNIINVFHATYDLKTFTVLKNETEKFTGDQMFYDESCVKMLAEHSSDHSTNQISLNSSCSDMFCRKYMPNMDYGSLMMQKYCPISGTIKGADLFIRKNYKVLYNYNYIYIFIDGCYSTNENGTRTDVLWILSDNFRVAESIVSKVYDNEFLFRRYRVEDILFNNMNKDCSNLCHLHSCSGNTFETPVDESRFSTNDFIYVGLIVCVISFVGVVFFCIKKRF